MNIQLAANGTTNANLNNNAISQALQASAPSMLSIFSAEGRGSGNEIASIAASFASANIPHSFSSLSAGVSGEINVDVDGNMKKKVSFNMVNETFASV